MTERDAYGRFGNGVPTFSYSGYMADHMHWNRPLTTDEIAILADPDDYMMSGLLNTNTYLLGGYFLGGTLI